MAHVPTLDAADASKEVVEVYNDFQRRMGFPVVPNFITTQGHSFAAVRGTWGALQNVLAAGTVPRTVKEMMLVAISHSRSCRYCEAAHLACCRMLGVEAPNLDALVSKVEGVSPPKTRAIILFGLKCAADPQALTEGDFDELRAHGLATSEVTEVIAMSALAVYINIIADATGVATDEMFSQF